MEAILISLMPLFVMVAIFYFMIIKPQQKKAKLKTQMLNDIVVGDIVHTIGGFVGKVEKINENTLIIKSSTSSLEVEKNAINDLVKE